MCYVRFRHCMITKTEFGDMRSVKMVIPMSGTVILNKPQDLFALLSLVDPINFVEVGTSFESIVPRTTGPASGNSKGRTSSPTGTSLW